MISRSDILKIIVNTNNLNTDNYDITVSFDDIKSNKPHIKIGDDFAQDFLKQLQKIITDDYEF